MNFDHIINALAQEVAKLAKEKAILTARLIELENKSKEKEVEENGNQ